jgi:hypothetical protein
MIGGRVVNTGLTVFLVSFRTLLLAHKYVPRPVARTDARVAFTRHPPLDAASGAGRGA